MQNSLVLSLRRIRLFSVPSIHPTAPIWGVLRKELLIQANSGLAFFNRLLLGPLVSLGTTGILYRAFFHTNPAATLGKMSGNDYTTFLLFGFAMHSYINSGYYCVSTRIMSEAHGRTLAVMWLSPFNRFLGIYGLGGVEAIRSLGILVFAMCFSKAPALPLWEAVGIQLIWFVLFFPFCLLLGFLRACFQLIRQDVADILDHLYLGFVLSACPYIPRDILPEALQPFALINPAYHIGEILRASWAAPELVSAHLPPLLWLMVLYASLGWFLWRRVGDRVVERCFA